MTKTLIIYSSTDGHTTKICSHIQQQLENEVHHITLLPLDSLSTPNLSSFDNIIIGASIRYGKHSKAIYDFIHENHLLLTNKPSAFFSVNLVARKPEKNTPQTNPYIKKLFKEITWQPNETAVFAGKVDYKKYNFLDRSMIRLIMWMTKGPTNPETCIEFTDWDAVNCFAKKIQGM